MIPPTPACAWIACVLLAASSARAEHEDPRTSIGADPARDTAPVRATDRSRARPQLETGRLDAAAERALERGLAWLAARAREQPDGTLPDVGLSARSGRGFAALAVEALAALAWMGDGNTPDRGPYGREVAAAVDFLVARCASDPEAPAPGYISQGGDALSRMHGHGFATLALSQAWTMSTRTARGAAIARVLPIAVRCIERTQGLEGGWWYEPKKVLDHEGSITITLAQALRSTQNLGVRVDPTTIARAVEYVKRSQKEDGSFRYAIADPASSIALTAAAIASLNATGTYGGKEVLEGYAWLFRALEARRAPDLGEAPNPLDPTSWKRDERRLYCRFYERLYVAQCLWQNADPSVFLEWARDETQRVIVAQADDGAWHDTQFGDAYATAMNCLYLEVPHGLLPIFQR